MSYRSLLAMAAPFILANAAVPTLGLVDTAVIGQTGTAADLGAIALGALIFNFIFWSFGFLRMGTTGFVAQADGQGDEPEVRAATGRSLLMAVVISALLLILTQPIEGLAFALFGAGEEVERIAAEYFRIRMWGAPASLSIFALLGVLIGLGQARTVLVVQLFLNGLNIGLDLLFAIYFEMGVQGIAVGTVIAEWMTLVVGSALVIALLRSRHQDEEPGFPWERIKKMSSMWSSLRSNLNIMIRTLFLVFGFAWFTDHGARYGDTVLAANHVLLQFIALAAFFLDGFANVVESLRKSLWSGPGRHLRRGRPPNHPSRRRHGLGARGDSHRARRAWGLPADGIIRCPGAGQPCASAGFHLCLPLVRRFSIGRDLHRHLKNPGHAKRIGLGHHGLRPGDLSALEPLRKSRPMVGLRSLCRSKSRGPRIAIPGFASGPAPAIKSKRPHHSRPNLDKVRACLT